MIKLYGEEVFSTSLFTHETKEIDICEREFLIDRIRFAMITDSLIELESISDEEQTHESYVFNLLEALNHVDTTKDIYTAVFELFAHVSNEVYNEENSSIIHEIRDYDINAFRYEKLIKREFLDVERLSFEAADKLHDLNEQAFKMSRISAARFEAIKKTITEYTDYDTKFYVSDLADELQTILIEEIRELNDELTDDDIEQLKSSKLSDLSDIVDVELYNSITYITVRRSKVFSINARLDDRTLALFEDDCRIYVNDNVTSVIRLVDIENINKLIRLASFYR